jgi:hypothetical protein
MNILFVLMQVLTDRSPLLTQIFSTDCRDALGQMLEAQVCYLHLLKFNCVVPNFSRLDFALRRFADLAPHGPLLFWKAGSGSAVE